MLPEPQLAARKAVKDAERLAYLNRINFGQVKHYGTSANLLAGEAEDGTKANIRLEPTAVLDRCRGDAPLSAGSAERESASRVKCYG